MSKIPNRHPPGEAVDHERGELRKPLDYASQPEQGGDISIPNPGHVNPYTDQAAREDTAPGRKPPGALGD
ncbi:hypothetical protein ACFFGH_00460 [Lysobacter korlensis]|uniref:Uncharacterized protein n=1 Tax=Lysobacter korlensis TaxID=553636 RepID=A0ABV6RH58_9GAMM